MADTRHSPAAKEPAKPAKKRVPKLVTPDAVPLNPTFERKQLMDRLESATGDKKAAIQKQIDALPDAHLYAKAVVKPE